MKQKTKKPAKRQQFWEKETPETNPAMTSFLSPLSLAVYKNKFTKFNFHHDNLILEVDRLMCMELFSAMRDHTREQKAILQKAKIKLLKRDPTIRKFLIAPLEKHNLPTRLYHTLKSDYCSCMEDVARRGEYRLKRLRGLGDDGLKLLIDLFYKNGCIILFT